MVSLKSIACLVTLFAASFASSVSRNIDVLPVDSSGFVPVPSPKANRGKIIAITDELLPVSRMEDSEFAFESSESGFGRITRVGISVNRGASAVANFDITVTAIDADTLDRNDESFVETLTNEEREEYVQLKERFNGGLSIPMFRLLGADLNERVTRNDLESAAEISQGDLESKSQALSEILESAVDTRIRINGTLTATGISFRRTTAFVFVKLARVVFEDGSSQVVVSTDPNDVVAADLDGNPVDSSDQTVDVICSSGFFC